MADQEKESEDFPKFPLAAYRGLSQTLTLSLEDGQCSEETVCSNVRVLTAHNNSPKKTSSMLTLKSEVDFLWEDRYYAGQLVAVHWTGWVLAYVIIDRETRDGAVRVISKKSGGRALVKGMKGVVHDLGFSQTEGEALLAIIDEHGTLFVHKVEEKANVLVTSVVFLMKPDVKVTMNCCNRVIWTYFSPDEEFEDHRLLILIGSKALLCHIGKLELAYVKNGNEPLVSSKLQKEDLQVIDGHTSDIMFAEFAPDASALATVSLDGSMQFYQIYMEQKPKCLHNWQPHGGQPLSFLSFLDNNKDSSPDGKIWKFVVTGAKNNTELKVWDCSQWSHIQTISMASEGQDLKLKAALDISASFLVLSDQVNRIVYLYKIFRDPEERSAHIESVSAYVVPFPILSFVILDVSTMTCDNSDNDSDLDTSDEEERESVVMLSLYLIHPKSLQDCKLQFLPSKELKLTTLVPNQPELPQPFTLMTPSECASSIKIGNELNNVLKEIDTAEAAVSGASSPSQEVCEILNLKEANETPRSFSSEPKAPTMAHNGFDSHSNSDAVANRNSASNAAILLNAFGVTAEPVVMKQSPKGPSTAELQQRILELEQARDLKTAEALDRLFDANAALLKTLEKREENERARHETMLTTLAKMVDKAVTCKLQEIVPSEIKKQFVPLVTQGMENVKRTVNAEIKQQLISSDQLLKENISKLVQNKSFIESLTTSVSHSVRNGINETCKDLMMNFVLPRMEKMLDRTFLQVNESFSSGLRESVNKYREETEKMRDGIKQAEASIRHATDLNKKSLNSLPIELEKSLLSIGNQIKKSLTETIQMEIKMSSVVDAGTIARAMTPAMVYQEKRQIITQLLATEQYNSAFQEALSASDLNLVVFTCEKIRAEQLFLASTSCPLQQPVLLSLIQQLTTDLGKNSELKSSYLMEAVLRLEVHHATTREFLPKVISEVERNISSYLATHPKEMKVCNELTRTLMVVKLLHGQTNSRS